MLFRPRSCHAPVAGGRVPPYLMTQHLLLVAATGAVFLAPGRAACVAANGPLVLLKHTSCNFGTPTIFFYWTGRVADIPEAPLYPTPDVPIATLTPGYAC